MILPGNVNAEDAKEILLTMGIRGSLRSIYYSITHTGSPDLLLLSKRVIPQISKKATLDLNSRFLVGLYGSGATHPKLGKSKLSIEPGGSIHVPAGGFARIGPCSSIHVEGEFSMGDSYINSHTRILCSKSITIGDDCAIAWNVELLDSDRHQIIYDGEPRVQAAPIEIEDNVWLGNNVTVKKGVTIGEGSVIASDSTVTNDIPPKTLAGGTPAEVLREDIEWEK